MRLEPRYKNVEGQRVLRGAVIVDIDGDELQLLDELFGASVSPDGLVGQRGIVEYRLSDGIGEAYLSIPRVP